MKLWNNLSFRHLPLKLYLSIFIVLIIVVLTLFLSTLSYAAARDQLMSDNEVLREYTEENALQAEILVDKGLRLYDNTYNEEMRGWSVLYVDAYERAGRDPAKLDLSALQQQFTPQSGGKIDLYVINKSGVIIASTVPEVMYLDFGRDFPPYYAYLKQGLVQDSFFADRVVRSVVSTESGRVTGQLRKFAFVPTPDHEYLLEIGLSSPEFEQERGQLSVVAAAEALTAINPNLVSVRVFDANKNLLAENGPDTSFIPGPELSGLLDRALDPEDDVWINSSKSRTKTHYLLVELPDDKTASDMNLVIELTYSDARLNQRLSSIILFHLAVGTVAIVLGILLSYAAASHITRPISEIITDADIIAQGDLNHPIRTMENPEFRMLRDSITVMIRRIMDYSAEIEREKADLQIAAEIQRNFLPDTIPLTEGFSIAAKSIPAKEVGGDFFDVVPLGIIPLSKHQTGIMIGDVSGKGVPAALFMALSCIVVRVTAPWFARPEQVIAEANPVISANSKTGMFVTLFYGVLDSTNRSLTFVNAGHNPPLVLRAGSDAIEELPSTGIALGVIEDAGYGQDTITLNMGDIVVLYTDGVTEANNNREEMFEVDRLVSVVRENRTRSSQEIVDAIIASVFDFSGDQPQFDDITIMVVKAG
jgi:serine phosphatase RsbU (regulator of sigma subunit)